MVSQPQRNRKIKEIRNSEHWKEIENKTPPGLFFGGALTSSNHATSCSAALANIDIIEKEKLVDNSKIQGKYLLDQLKAKFKNSLSNTGLDTVFLSKAYEIEDLDRVEIYDILKKIYK